MKTNYEPVCRRFEVLIEGVFYMYAVKEYLRDMQGCDVCLSKYFELTGQPIENGIIQVWEILKNYGIDTSLWKSEISDLSCPKCNHKLELNTYFVNDFEDFTTELAERISESLNEEIEECNCCNTGKIVYEQRNGDPGRLSTVWEYLNGNGVSKELGDLNDEILSRIRCKCGTELNLDDPFVTRMEIDDWYGERDSEIIIRTFNIEQGAAQEFVQYLYKYPMLGLESEIGKQIYNKILSNDVEGITNITSGEVFYRARKRNIIQRQVSFISSELWEPPKGISSHGRFNPVGVQVLYLCDSPETGMWEIHCSLKDEEISEVAQFVALKDLRVWDVRELDIKDFVSMPSLNNRTISKEYLLPNFLAQCFSLAGINGIKYESVKNKGGWNLALFNYSKNHSIALVEIDKNCNLPVANQEVDETEYFERVSDNEYGF